MGDWQSFYFDALERGFSREAAEFHADMMQDLMSRQPDQQEQEFYDDAAR